MNRSWAMWKTPNNMCQNQDCSQASAGWGRDERLGPRPREFCVCCLIPKCQEKVASRPSLSFLRDKMGTEWVRGGLRKTQCTQPEPWKPLVAGEEDEVFLNTDTIRQQNLRCLSHTSRFWNKHGKCCGKFIPEFIDPRSSQLARNTQRQRPNNYRAAVPPATISDNKAHSSVRGGASYLVTLVFT